MKFLFPLLVILIVLSSCEDSIAPLSDCTIDSDREGIFVLCEGLYGYNNATLWFANQYRSEEVFSCANKGRHLGDTANDLITINDSSFAIIVSSSNELFVCNKRATIIKAGFITGPKHFLKKGALLNDSTLLITDLYADIVWSVNLNTMKFDTLISRSLCAPDGIAIHNNIVAVCNSGYGIFRYKENHAGTVLMYNYENNSSTIVPIGINVQNISYSPYSHSWIAQYAHITSMKDSLGGIVEFSENTFDIIASVKGKFTSKPVIDNTNGSMYIIRDNSLYEMYCKNGKYSSSLTMLLENKTSDSWYKLISGNGKIYVCNAANYLVDGSILIVDPLQQNIISILKVGMNPNSLCAFQ